MKVVIFAGGRGMRLAEYTDHIPKPMIPIGGIPLLQHIIGIYGRFGFNDFLIAGGYKLDVIDRWLADANLPWNVQLVDTGLETNTGGRLQKLEKRLSEPFMLTYGDGVSDIDIHSLVKFHNSHEAFCTVTAVRPPRRFGDLTIDNNYVTDFEEKQVSGWINGGFFVCDPEVFKYIEGNEPWETGALTRMAINRLLTVYKHEGFWQCCDTIAEVRILEKLASGGAPWIGKISE